MLYLRVWILRFGVCVKRLLVLVLLVLLVLRWWRLRLRPLVMHGCRSWY